MIDLKKYTRGILATAFFSVSASAISAAEPSVGVQMFTLRDSGSLEQQLAIAHNAGFRNIETVGTQGVSASELNALLRKYDMKVSSSHVALADIRTDLQGAIDFNKAVGNNVLVVPYLPPEIRPTDAAGWAALGTELKGVSQILKANGQTLLYHNHGEELALYDGKYAIEILLDAAGPDVKSQLDLAWVARAGRDPVEVLKRLNGQVYAVHAKDNVAGVENIEGFGFVNLNEWGFAAVGSGVLNWQAIIPAVYASGAQLYVVEHDMPNDALFTISSGLRYLSANINLRPDFRALGTTPNQLAVAGVINNLDPMNDVYSATYLSTGPVSGALEQFSGSIHASAQSALVQDTQLFRDAINNRLRSAFAHAKPLAPSSTEVETGELTFWTAGLAAKGSQDSSNAGDLDRKVSGFLIGADAPLFDTWNIGLTAGYSRSSFDNLNSDGSSDNYHFGAYAGTRAGALSFRSGLAYTRHDIETKRNISIASFSGTPFIDTLSGNYDGDTFQAFGEVGYNIDVGAVNFEPYAGLAHVRLKTDGFTESGGAAALSSTDSSTNATFTTLGVKTQTSFDLGGVQTVARGGLGWRHAFGDVDPTSTHRFAAGDTFTVSGSPIASNVALVEAGLDFNISPTAVLGVSYIGQFGSGARSNAVNANLKIRF